MSFCTDSEKKNLIVLKGACSQNANDMLDIRPAKEHSKATIVVSKNYCISSHKITHTDPKFDLLFEKQLGFGV